MGNQHTKLVVLRGNSGSGKTTTATALRKQLGRGIALVQQDVFRRVVLREHDVPNGVNIGLISLAVRYALDAGYHVILEGIFHAARYRGMLRELAEDHRGETVFYYFDVSFEETVRRHESRPQATEFTPTFMASIYTAQDLLGDPAEHVIAESSSLTETVERILSEGFCLNDAAVE